MKKNEKVIEIENNGRIIRIAAHHADHEPFIRQQFEFYWNAVEPTLGKGLDLIEDFSYSHKQRLPDGREWIFTGMPETPAEIQLYLDTLDLQPGDVVLDAGAYCGLVAATMADLVGPTGKIICIEPDALNYRYLIQNTKKYKNILYYHAALWCERGVMAFAGHGNTSSALGQLSGGPATEDAQLIPIADLPPFTKAKIDIEGAELVIAKDLWGKVSHAIIETHPLIYGIHTKDVLWGPRVTAPWHDVYITWKNERIQK